MQGIYNRLEVGRTSFVGSLCPSLDRTIGEQGVTFRLVTDFVEVFDEVGVARIGFNCRRCGEDRAFAGITGNCPIFKGVDRVTRHDHGVHALCAHLTNDQTEFCVVTTIIQNFDAFGLQLGHQSRVVFLSRGDCFVKGFGYAVRIEVFLGFVSQTFGISLFVMNDGDFLVAIVCSQVFTSNFTLLIVTTANTEHVVHVTFGQLRVGRSRGNLDDALFEVNFRSRDRGTRAEVTSNKCNIFANQLVGNSNSLFRIASVIADFEDEHFAVHATSCVDISNCFLCTLGHLFAKCSIRTGHRTNGRDNDVSFCYTH